MERHGVRDTNGKKLVLGLLPLEASYIFILSLLAYLCCHCLDDDDDGDGQKTSPTFFNLLISFFVFCHKTLQDYIFLFATMLAFTLYNTSFNMSPCFIFLFFLMEARGSWSLEDNVTNTNYLLSSPFCNFHSLRLRWHVELLVMALLSCLDFDLHIYLDTFLLFELRYIPT